MVDLRPQPDEGSLFPSYRVGKRLWQGQAGFPCRGLLRYPLQGCRGPKPTIRIPKEVLVPETPNLPVMLGLDMGGTHTDAVLMRGGRLAASAKVPTNHQDLLGSMREALHTLFASGPLRPSDVTRATFGTTLAVNAVVQKACAPVGLLLAAGPGLDPAPFGLGNHTAVVPGSMDHRGTELTPPDREAIRRIAEGWKAQGLTAFACVTKFSTRNPSHETIMAEVIRDVFAEGPEPTISLGHRLSGRLNFPRRIATAYWNAAIWALHNRFADAVEASLSDLGIHAPTCLLKADGGAIPLSDSRSRPVEALLSGPAASVMGMLALRPAPEDLLVLDMGGTTTDIALLADGQPVLSPEDLVVEGRSTLVRSLKSVSIGLGGDSRIALTPRTQVGPLRTGPAMAFGGTHPTFLDCLNVLGLARAGNRAASRSGVAALAAEHDLTANELSWQALDSARAQLAEAVRTLLDEVNSQPVYTLAALLEGRAIRPLRAVLVGGPAEAVAPLLGETLGIPVETLDAPERGQIANAIGAALTRPTASLDLFADTAAGVLLVPGLDIRRRIGKRYTLEEAKAEACALLRERAASPHADIDVTEAQVFATLDEYGRGGRDIRVRCQIRPGVAC